MTPAAEGKLRAIAKPPGRRPATELLETNAWYKTLSAEERTRCVKLLRWWRMRPFLVFLLFFDGVRVVEDSPEKGHFKLTFRKGTQEWDLNPSDGIFLHDILNTEH